MNAKIQRDTREQEGQRGEKGKQKKHPSLSGVLMRDLIMNITATSSGHKLQNGEYRKHPVEPKWRCPHNFEMEELSMPHFSMEYAQAP